jgi:hypothetical protein
MLLRFTCPGCQFKVAADTHLIGKKVFCPACHTVVPLRMPEGPAMTEDLAVLSELPEAAADVAGTGIAPAEVGPSRVGSSDEAKAALAQLKSELPPVTSAYQPSGVMPAGALGYMILGIPLGAALAALAFAVCAIITGLLLWGLAALNLWLANAWNLICFLSVLAEGFVGFVGAAISFAAAGGVAGSCITGMGKQGNNRNTVFPALLALVAAGLTALLIWEGFERWGAARLDAILDVAPGDLATLYKITFWIGVAIAMGVAASTASSQVKEAKFCEDCQLYMNTGVTDTLHLGAVKLLAHALTEHDIAAALAAAAGTGGKDGSANLFHCPQCERGYLEATVQFKVTWKGDESEEEKAESWLAGSAELSPEEVRRFKPFISTPTPS